MKRTICGIHYFIAVVGPSHLRSFVRSSFDEKRALNKAYQISL